MQILNKNKLVFVDVDNTLIMWDTPSSKTWHPHKEHIEKLEQFKARGQGVVVWSAGGYEWAVEAVKMLKIEHLVDLVMGKPDWYIDDLEAGEWMPYLNRIFLEEKKD